MITIEWKNLPRVAVGVTLNPDFIQCPNSQMYGTWFDGFIPFS